ncbi:FtsX-like permease family protein [Terribacillus saccharophilus]|uniref:ABC transporter permease n=1 Tax=Terribacillus saccharophilus TaxID=361277 RepID=A0ABX4GTA5_9BACI|nr:ABC transporter permease [Terribacillus saccharophilus]PAD33585.1 ABC transporter permease [Terribacillus saccharophilus]PAD94354.1 ABC transporter permease [Terribacillus saccharophilus]PAD98098.1 ABC transporter permease [Terribacillus saccharophilus]
MNFRQFAFRNVLRNKRLYIAYFLSSMFTVMVFFTFAIFAFHPAFSEGSVNKYAIFGMAVAGGIIYIFSFFFILYSMSSFLQSRKKEFGLLITLGASDKQIRLMVFLENILIGFFATAGGILIGLVFAKSILLIAENILIIDESLDFYFPALAIVVTFVSFIFLFFCISVLVAFILRTNKLVDLIKGDKQSKGEPKASIVLSILAVFLLIAGYGTALYVKGASVVFVMIPVIIVVTLGTYILFTQLSVYCIRLMKKNKSIFWRKTNMLLFGDLSFRMKDNARTFFMVAIISTVAFSAIGSLYGFQSYLTKGIKEINPYTYTYSPFLDDSEEIIEQDIQQINSIIEEEKIDTEMEEAELVYFDTTAEESSVLIVKASDYNRFAALISEKELHPEENEAIVVEQSDAVITGGQKASDILMTSSVQLENGQEIQPSKTVESAVGLGITGYYVVNDSTYTELGTPGRTDFTAAWNVLDGNDNQLIEAGRKLEDQVEHKVFAVDYNLYEINKAYGPILFIGLFIGIVFFVSAGSFLYFRLFTDIDGEKRKFQSIAKIGLTQSELKKVVNRQVAILFFSPIVVALVHGAVALTALSRLFNYNLTVESALVLGSFAVIQVLYFLVVRFIYVKNVIRTVF